MDTAVPGAAPSGLQLDLLASILRLHTVAADIETADPFLGQSAMRDLIVQTIARLTPHLTAATRGWATSRGFLPRAVADEVPRLRRLGENAAAADSYWNGDAQ